MFPPGVLCAHVLPLFDARHLSLPRIIAFVHLHLMTSPSLSFEDASASAVFSDVLGVSMLNSKFNDNKNNVIDNKLANIANDNLFMLLNVAY